jgi:DNA-directed RNA polymerase alpha subunit
MVSLLYFLLIINPVVSADTMAHTQDSSAADSADLAVACKRQQKDLGCESLKADPDVAAKMENCDSPERAMPVAEIANACLNNVLGAWGEIFEQAPNNAHEAYLMTVGAVSSDLKSQAQPGINKFLFLKTCPNSPDCLRRLYNAAYKRFPTNDEEKTLRQKIDSRWIKDLPSTEVTALYDKACGVAMVGCSSKDPWFNSRLQELFGRPRRQASPDLISKVQELIYSKHKKYVCLNSVGRTEMWCYGIATVIDPLIAVGVASKMPKLAKLAQATRSTAEAGKVAELSRLQAAGRILGREVDSNSPVGIAIEKAHRVGEGQIGRDGVRPAGINLNGTTNYTNRQLDEKRKILAEAGLNHDQIKALMDNGIVGTSVQSGRANALGLGLSNQVETALRGFGVESVDDLMGTSEYQLSHIPELGPEGVAQIKAKLAERGLSLRGGPVKGLGLSNRVDMALRRNGVESVYDLVGMSERELSRMPDMGPQNVAHIKEKLAASGLSLRAEPTIGLGLSNRVEGALRSGGVESVEDLVRLSEQDLLRMRNMGRESVAEIRERLNARGLSLRP